MWSVFIIAAALAASTTARLVLPLGAGQNATPRDRQLTAGLACAMPVAALALYLFLGAPDLPADLRVFRDLHEIQRRHYGLLAQKPMETLLHKDPDDIGALLTLAGIHQHQGQNDEAIAFFTRAAMAATAQNDVRTRAIFVALGEAMIKANNGTVTPEAKAVFDRIRETYPASPIARHYLALYAAQQGDKDAALAAWRDLLAESHPGDPWRKMVRREMVSLRKDMQK